MANIRTLSGFGTTGLTDMIKSIKSINGQLYSNHLADNASLLVRSLTFTGLTLCAAFSVGCSTSYPVNKFVAADETNVGDAQFQQLKLSNGVQPSHLEEPQSTYRLNVGDALNVEIVNQPDSGLTCIVMPDGLIYYDLAGGVMAEGKTVTEVEEILTKKLSAQQEYVLPTVSANVAGTASQTYVVLGQVGTPGSYSATKPTRLLDAIALCGGIQTGLADLRRSIVVRDNRMICPDFEALIENGDMSQNLYLRPDDHIFIPLIGRDKVHILGEVNNPSSTPFLKDISLISAIATVGGPTQRAALRRVAIVRGSSAAPRIAIVNFKDIMTGSAPDIRLQPDDIVWLPRSPWEKLEEYANDAVRTAVSSATNKVVREFYREDSSPAPARSMSQPAVSSQPSGGTSL
ncbi:MAG: SLBB domain-containing protein [Verrucomicrobiales bacterium]